MQEFRYTSRWSYRIGVMHDGGVAADIVVGKEVEPLGMGMGRAAMGCANRNLLPCLTRSQRQGVRRREFASRESDRLWKS